MLIGFVGRARSGKSTAVSFLKEIGFLDEEAALAGWLKARCSELFDIPASLFDGSNPLRDQPLREPVLFTAKMFMALRDEVQPNSDGLKGLPLVGRQLHSLREILQFVGTDVIRTLDSDWHLKKLAQGLDARKRYGVSDVRFPNEAAGLRLRGGVLVHISRDVADATPVLHASEHTGQLSSYCHYHLTNNGTLEDFHEKLLGLRDELLRKERWG